MAKHVWQGVVVANTQSAPALNKPLTEHLQRQLKDDIRKTCLPVGHVEVNTAKDLYSIGQLVAEGFRDWQHIDSHLKATGDTQVRPIADRFEGGFFVLPIVIVEEGDGRSIQSIEKLMASRSKPKQLLGLPLSLSSVEMFEDNYQVRINRLRVLDLRTALAMPIMFSSMAAEAQMLISAIFQKVPLSITTKQGVHAVFDPTKMPEVCILLEVPPLDALDSEVDKYLFHLRELKTLLTQIYRIPMLIVPATLKAVEHMSAEDIRRAALSHGFYSQFSVGLESKKSAAWTVETHALVDGYPAWIDVIGTTSSGRHEVYERHVVFDLHQLQELTNDIKARAKLVGATCGFKI